MLKSKFLRTVILTVATLGTFDAIAQSAMGCVVSQQNALGGWDILNNCSYSVTASWCVVGYDCKAGNHIFSNTWTIRSGTSYPVSGSRGRKIEYAACKGSATIRGVGNDEFECQK